MSSLTTAEKVTVLNTVISTTSQDLHTHYSELLNRQAGSITNGNILAAKQQELQSTLDKLTREADTRDTEFADRMASGAGKLSFLQARGFNTWQDYVLGAFFLSYAFAVFVLIIYVARFSKKDKLMVSAYVLLFATVFAFIIGFILIRFA